MADSLSTQWAIKLFSFLFYVDKSRERGGGVIKTYFCITIKNDTKIVSLKRLSEEAGFVANVTQ